MEKKQSYKKIKYEEMMLGEINSFLRQSLSDSRLKFVSVTKVILSEDYSHAKVYWDTFDTHKRGDAKKAIDGIASKVRSHLSGVMKVKQVPALSFSYDSQYEDEQKITDLLTTSEDSAES